MTNYRTEAATPSRWSRLWRWLREAEQAASSDATAHLFDRIKVLERRVNELDAQLADSRRAERSTKTKPKS